jgi:hypothetical protein
MRPAVAKFLQNPTRFSVLKGLPLAPSTLPPKVAHVQTDGSFTTFSRTAVLLRTIDRQDYTLRSTYLDHVDSTQSEWCSILDGILFSKRKDQGSIQLENDCFGVIQALLRNRPPRDDLAAHYYTSIFKELRELDHFGIRWIPREMNKADELFRVTYTSTRDKA